MVKILDGLHAFLWFHPSVNNCNTYLIDAGNKILIDPGHDHLFGHVREGLSKLSIAPEDIDLVILTHGHPDHLEGIRAFINSKTLVAIHEKEMAFIRETSSLYGREPGLSDFEPHLLLREGHLNVGHLRFRVIHCPGHSPGSVCLYWEEKRVLFSGDTLFDQGIGRSDLPGGDGQKLRESIQKLKEWDVEVLLPGHGGFLSGKDKVMANFRDVESLWFGLL